MQQVSYGIVRIGETPLAIPLDHLSEVCHVDRLDPLPITAPNLLGGFNLRGNIVPVLGLPGLTGSAPETRTVPLYAVLKGTRGVMAFQIDEVVDIAKIDPGQIQELGHNGTEDPALYQGVFHHRNWFVSIINVDALFAGDSVFSAAKTTAQKEKTARHRTEPMLVFEAGGALLALPAIEVYAAVPRQDITVSAITAGPCLGEISYYNRRIPIVCPISVFGLGHPQQPGPCEIVVLRFPDNRLIGLAVQSIRNIESFLSDQADTGIHRLKKSALVTAVQVQQDGQQVHILSPSGLHQDDMMSDIASLSDEDRSEDRGDQAALPVQADTGNVTHEREKYLVVEAGQTVAIPLQQINCILDAPQRVTAAKVAAPGFRGFFSRLGHSVALFDLAGFLDHHGNTDGKKRVILTGQGDTQVGFGVDRVISIEVSSWREKSSAQTQGDLPAVKLGPADDKRVLPLLDLGQAVSTRLNVLADAYGSVDGP